MAEPLDAINYGISIGIPLSGKPVAPEWAISLAVQSWPINVAVNWLTVKGKPVDEARNLIVKYAKERNVRYLWFVDEDVAVPHFAVTKLMYELRHRQMEDPKANIIGGVYCTKSEVPEPIVFKKPIVGCYWDWTIGEVFECDHVGCGCMLIDMSVFDQVPEPWFKTVEKIYDNSLVFQPFDDHTPTVLRDQGNEDSYFTAKVQLAGFKIYAHGGVLCPHWDAKNGKAYVLPMTSHPVTSVDPEVIKAAQVLAESKIGAEG